MRIIAIGDIHGCRASLEALAGYAGLSEADTIVTLGDYVDRGPDSKGVIDLLLAWQRKWKVVCLMGNHEVMMLEARKSAEHRRRWASEAVGGQQTLDSYGLMNPSGIPEAHWEFIESGLPYFETDDFIFVHGGVLPKRQLAKQPDAVLYWWRIHQARPHRSGKLVICGHTSQKNGLPVHLGHTICIDTWACGTGWLTALDPVAGTYWQANEQGACRKGDIADRIGEPY